MASTFVDKQPAEYGIDRSKIKIDFIGIFLLILGIGALQTVLEKGESEDWFQTGYIIWLTLAAVFGLIGFIVWELTVPNPVLDLRVLKNRNLAAGVVLTFVGGYGLFAAVFVFPVMTQRILGYTSLEAGLELLPGALCALVILPFVGRRLSAGTPAQAFIIPGFIISVIFCFSMYFATPDAGQDFFFYPLLLRGIGTALLTIPLVQQSVADLKPHQMPYGIALTNMMRQLGGAFGIAITNTYIAGRIAIHRGDLIANVQAGDGQTADRLNQLTQVFSQRMGDAAQATEAAYRTLDLQITKQASLMGYLDSFLLTGAFFAITLPLILLTKTAKPSAEVAKAAAEAH